MAIDPSCLNSIPQMFYCSGVEVFGSALIASVAFFLIVAYIMHKAGLSMTASLSLGFVFLFSMFWIIAEETFKTLMLLILLVAGIAFALVFIQRFKG